jgi:group I intron endonuclease
MFVYLITNTINGKRYVGQHSGADLDGYFKHNIARALRGEKFKPALYAAICKYGAENFKVCPLVIVQTKEWMDYYERALIKAFNTKAPNGYNLTEGGDGTLGCSPTEETRRKMSLASKGKKLSQEHRAKISSGHLGIKPSPEAIEKTRQANIGRKASEETKAKMSAAGRGRKLSDETRRRISAARTGRSGPGHSEEAKRKISLAMRGKTNSLGYHHSEEAIRKISQASRVRRHSDEARKKISEASRRYWQNRKKSLCPIPSSA